MAENKYPPVRLDEETYRTIKANAKRSGRKIGAEIRQMLCDSMLTSGCSDDESQNKLASNESRIPDVVG